MTDREKLVELLDIIIQPGQKTLGDIADHLLANGVTFAKDNNVPSKWIPVTERLPVEGERVIASGAKGGVFMIRATSIEGFGKVDGASSYRNYTHWMPLPNPPKEGE